jgi:glycosyltransferase involved in cell wall biosynthesis
MNSTPLVSVAMATYNGADYLKEQISSILGQSYPNLELIITDDASSDETLTILRDFENCYERIKIFRHRVNQGITATFESSIKNCSGEFIAISDQDDIWELNKIEVLMNAMENEDVICSDSELVDKSGQTLNKRISSLVNLKSFYSGVPFLMGICLPGHTMMMQGDFAKYILPMPDEVMYDRWISFCAAANNGIKYVNLPLVKYRQHESNYFGVGKSRNKKNLSSKTQKFRNKLMELNACSKAPVKDVETKMILEEMLSRFNRRLSLSRCLFFLRNRNKLLVIKKKTGVRKILFCLKMFFKPNY